VPTVSITWRIMDSNACPVCKAIDGYTWIFTDQIPDNLVHPQYGEVWNTSIGSLAHEHFSAKQGGFPSSCRCHIEPEFDLKDLLTKVRALHDEIKSSLEETAT